MTVERIMELTARLEDLRQSTAPHEALQSILDDLSPEERAFWDELAPMVLDPDKLVEIRLSGPGGFWAG